MNTYNVMLRQSVLQMEGDIYGIYDKCYTNNLKHL